MVMVQDPQTSDYDGMPIAAIEKGVAHAILSPEKMGYELDQYFSHPLKKWHIPKVYSWSEGELYSIFELLRNECHHDFSHYKTTTIHRRIARRMALCKINDLSEYIRYLEEKPREIVALFQDFLIGVTSFFRDKESFKVLETSVIPYLWSSDFPEKPIRVWVAGCSTGEEAYTLAIIIKEYMEKIKKNINVQIFATDIDTRSIAIARTGVYSQESLKNLSPQRISRFFNPESNGSYRIDKTIRDMVIFSEQNIIQDPPFSKLDLISCRNVLIYMSSQLQQKIIPLFYYALNPQGKLFLGSSENIGAFGYLFAPLDQKSKIYIRKEGIDERESMGKHRYIPELPLTLLSPKSEKTAVPLKVHLREMMHHSLLEHSRLSGAIVNQEGDILYLYGGMTRYLQLPSGETTVNNIITMSSDNLHRELRIALHHAVLTNEEKHTLRVAINQKENTSPLFVDVTVAPLGDGLHKGESPCLFGVIIEESRVNDVLTFDHKSPDEGSQIISLQNSLAEQEKFLKLLNKKLETSNRELKLFQEESQSLNEELQSTNEELETSKEELQSVNEELSIVNAQLQAKVFDLSRANNDMNNLFAGTNIGIVFVDHTLCVMRFTPAITDVIHLILSDIGRPIAHIVSNLKGYSSLVKDTQSVLDTLTPLEIEVCTHDEKYYLMRIQPYRTLENIIEGAVISFINITEIVQMRHALEKANKTSRLAIVVRDAFDAITVQGLDGKTLAWNNGATRMYGWSEEEALQMNVRQRIVAPEKEVELLKITQLSQAMVLDPYKAQRLTKEGKSVNVWIIATALVDDQGVMYGICTTERLIPKKED
jgi:two-component system CheB/CheR fusion protein